MLTVRLRYIWTSGMHDRMFRGRAHYRLCNHERKIDNYDQRLTDDFQIYLNLGLGRITASLYIPTPESMLYGVFISMWSIKTAFNTLNEQDDSGNHLPSWFKPSFIGVSMALLLAALAVYVLVVNKVSLFLFNNQYLEGELRWQVTASLDACSTMRFIILRCHLASRQRVARRSSRIQAPQPSRHEQRGHCCLPRRAL